MDLIDMDYKYCPYFLTARKILSAFAFPLPYRIKYGVWSRIISSCAFNYQFSRDRARSPYENPYILNYRNSTTISAIEFVINNLKSQEVLNIIATVKKYKVNRYILLYYFKGKIGFKANRVKIKSLLNK